MGSTDFLLRRKLGSHVWYIIANELSLHEIAKINSNTEKWKDRDFINCYAQQGNEHYVALRDFKEKYGFPTNICMKLLSNGTVLRDGGVHTTDKEKFNSGQFRVGNLDQAEAIAQKVLLFYSFPKHKTGPFVEAICKILKSGVADLFDIAAKWEKNPQMLTAQGNAKDYLTNLETIYNQNAKIRKVIYE